MPTSGITTKVGIDGEKEYKAALSEMSSGLKVLQSEMRKVSAEYADNADSAEALTAKSDVLQRQILTQKEKVDALRDALENAAQTYGESDKRTQAWQIQLNNAEAELAKMESSLKDTSKETKGFGDLVSTLSDKLGIKLPQNATNALNSLGGVNTKVLAAVSGFAALAAAVGKVEQKFIDLTKEAAAAADEVLTASKTSGLDTTTVQSMQYAAELLDVSFDQINDGLKEVTNKMQEARDGSEDTAAKFKQLGVSITDGNGNLRNAEDVFYEVIDTLGAMTNETERDALAMDLLSEQARNLNPLIEAGSETFKEYAQEAKDVGYVMDNTALTALGRVDDAYQRLDKSVDGARNQIAAKFAPSLEKVLGYAQDFVTRTGEALADSGIVEDFGSILESVGGLLEPLGVLIETILPAIEPLLKPIAEVIALISDTIKVIVGILTLNKDLIKEGLGLSVSSGKLSSQQKLKYANSGWVYDEATGMWTGNGARNAAGTQNWPGGLTWVGENGPELVNLPRGSSISTAQESRSGGDVYYISIDAKSVQEFNDIVRIAQNARMTARKVVVA